MASGLMGPTKSMLHLANAQDAKIGRKGISSLVIGGFVHWQASQCFTNFTASLNIVGHQSLDHKMFLAVVSLEKCPPGILACAWCKFLEISLQVHKAVDSHIYPYNRANLQSMCS